MSVAFATHLYQSPQSQSYESSSGHEAFLKEPCVSTVEWSHSAYQDGSVWKFKLSAFVFNFQSRDLDLSSKSKLRCNAFDFSFFLRFDVYTT